MPYNDLREFMSSLEQERELSRVKAEVYLNYGIGAICSKNYSLGTTWLHSEVS